MGSCHSDPCNSVASRIWALYEQHKIWLTAAQIPGKENVIADLESRSGNLDTQWILNPKYYHDRDHGWSCFRKLQ